MCLCVGAKSIPRPTHPLSRIYSPRSTLSRSIAFHAQALVYKAALKRCQSESMCALNDESVLISVSGVQKR